MQLATRASVKRHHYVFITGPTGVGKTDLACALAQQACRKGYHYADVRVLLHRFGYTLHIKSRGEEDRERRANPRYRARRWVVERSHSWMNLFRRLLIRCEKKVATYEAMLHFACAWITLRAAGVFG